MRRVIRKRIRRKADGVDLALDLDATFAVNLGPRPAQPERDVAGGAERHPADPGVRLRANGPGDRNDPRKEP